MSGRLSTTEWGPEGAGTVVLLHGFMGSAGDWEPVARRLADRYRVVGVDLPGHGASLGLPAADYTIDGAARAVIDSTARFGRFTLVGYSMGGRIAYHVVTLAPGRVSALVAESAHPGIEFPEARADRLGLDRERARRLIGDPGAFLEAWYRAPMFGSLADDATLRQAIVERRLKGDPVEWARALESMGTGNQEPVGERLRETRVPTLLVAGGRDEPYTDRLGAMAARTGSWLHVRPGAGHAVHLEQPAAFAALVAAFIENRIQHRQSCP